MRAWRWAAVSTVAWTAAMSACDSTPSRESPPQVPGGNPAAGAELIAQFGCGSCHMIPGIREADGRVGPPLAGFAQRQIIAGQLSNNADNLIAWIIDTPSIEPGTAMPNLNVTEDQARDIAAYLFTLE